MMRATIAGGAFAIIVVLLAVVFGYLAFQQFVDPFKLSTPAFSAGTEAEAHPSFLYGRITAANGTTFEGRLRWGQTQEAFWSDYFNGVKKENTWAAQVPPEKLLKDSSPIKVFGIEIARGQNRIALDRPFMARFGDIARIEMLGRIVRMTLKSGTVFDLDYFSLNDLADGVRVWDNREGIVDLDALQIRTIDFLSAPRKTTAAPSRLYGTVHTQKGNFTGFVQWNRNKGVRTDELHGRTDDGNLSLRFDTIRSIARHATKSSKVTLLDGREIVLSDTQEAGRDNLGIYVDDSRYGRVLVSWDTFERVDFSLSDGGPSYGDFPPGRELTGSLTTHGGRRLAGRLVYDLDESETTETLDASSDGVDYTVPFELIASIVLSRSAEPARVTLRNGQTLHLDRSGDLGEGNGGVLVFVGDGSRPEYVRWNDVGEIVFHAP